MFTSYGAQLTPANPQNGLVWTKKDCEEKFAELAEVVQLQSGSREEFFKDLDTKYKGITAIYRHNDSVGKLSSWGDVMDGVGRNWPKPVAEGAPLGRISSLLDWGALLASPSP